MVDLLAVLLIVTIAGLGAELVRASCRRQLLAPVRVQHPAGVPAARGPGSA